MAIPLSLSCLAYFYLVTILGCPNLLKPIAYTIYTSIQLSASCYLENENIKKLEFVGTVTSSIISLSGNFTYVIVEEQEINVLCKNLFDIKGEIKEINFISCKMKKIERNCFSKVIVDTILINSNNISIIKKYTFNNIKVQVINLKENQIQVIENHAFYKLSNLKTLLLEYNKLKVINPELFSNMPNLEKLKLDYNEIQNINANFLHLSHLQEVSIDLPNNRIVRLDPNAFNRIEAKKIHLDLHENFLTYLPDFVFENHYFGKIDLEKNPLSNISTKLCDKCTIDEIIFDNEIVTNFSQTFSNFSKDKNVKITSYYLKSLKSGNRRSAGVLLVIIRIGLIFNGFVR